jgi:hypothetical protein
MVGRPVITTVPAAEPLLLTLVKQALRIDAGDTSQDEYLNLLIQDARESAETFQSRGLITQTITEYYDFFPGAHFPLAALDGMGDGVGLGSGLGDPYVGRRNRHRHDYLELSRSPLKTLNSVKYKDPNGVTQIWPTDQYVVNDKQDPAQISRAPRVCWPRTLCEVNSVWAEYVVGYSDDGSKVPAATKQAMLLMIADWDANRLPVKVESEAVTNQLLKNKVYYQP